MPQEGIVTVEVQGHPIDVSVEGGPIDDELLSQKAQEYVDQHGIPFAKGRVNRIVRVWFPKEHPEWQWCPLLSQPRH